MRRRHRRADLTATASQRADQRRPEAAIRSQPDAPSRGQLIPPTRSIPAAAQQPATFAAAQDLVQDRLPSRLLTQDADPLHGAARAKRAARYRLEDREFDQPKRIARLHPPSLGGRGSFSQRCAPGALPAAATSRPAPSQRTVFLGFGMGHRAGCYGNLCASKTYAEPFSPRARTDGEPTAGLTCRGESATRTTGRGRSDHRMSRARQLTP